MQESRLRPIFCQRRNRCAGWLLTGDTSFCRIVILGVSCFGSDEKRPIAQPFNVNSSWVRLFAMQSQFSSNELEPQRSHDEKTPASILMSLSEYPSSTDENDSWWLFALSSGFDCWTPTASSVQRHCSHRMQSRLPIGAVRHNR